MTNEEFNAFSYEIINWGNIPISSKNCGVGCIFPNSVINLFEELFKNYPLPEQFIVRNDNGSQFEALIVQDFLKNKGVIQEFTKPATPEQNEHIESYHSIMESAVCQRFEFHNLRDFQETMVRWKKFYNFERIHGGLKYKSPKKFLESIGVSIDPKWNN
jgi:transposase InsO family protein